MAKKRKISEVNIQRTANGYYVYSHDSYDTTPRVFEDSAQGHPLERALDYAAELFNTNVPNKK